MNFPITHTLSILCCTLLALSQTAVSAIRGDTNPTAIDNNNNSPFREWMTGYWQGNPIYSPIGPFGNYSIIFRPYNSSLYPTNTVMIETDYQAWTNTPINGSYQRWMIVDNTVTYCGLLTFNDGIDFAIAMPTFHYQPQMSDDNQVAFCGHPIGGGCDAFKWLWKYSNTDGTDGTQHNKTDRAESNTSTSSLWWWNQVGGVPHQDTTFHKIEDKVSSDVVVQGRYRKFCNYVLGSQEPYNYNWMFYNISSDSQGSVIALSELSKDVIRAKVESFYGNNNYHHH